MNDAQAVGAAVAVPSNPRGWYAIAIKLAAGVSLLSFLLWRFDLRSAFRLIARERPLFFLAAMMLFVAGQVMSAFRWQLVAKLNGLRGCFRDYLAYYFIGMFTNLFVPGLVGGDALRALYLGRRHHRLAEAVASAMADRGVGLLALFWFAAAATVCIGGMGLAGSVVRSTIAMGAAALVAYLAAPLIAAGAPQGEGRLGRLIAPVISYMRRPVGLMPAVLLSLVLQFSLAVCQYLLALGLGLEMRLTTLLVIVPIANVFASLPITINGLGTREASYLVLMGMAGIGKGEAVALSLLYFMATLAGGVSGVVPFILTAMPVP